MIELEMKNPRKNRDGSIDVDVNHPEMGWVAFTATQDDPTGSEVYAKAITGAFGVVTLDKEKHAQEEASEARGTRNNLLAEIDVLVSNPMRWSDLSASEKASLRAYRKELLNVPQQEGFPKNIVWPVSPL